MFAREIGAVVLNGSPTGLNTVRSLGSKGIPTAVIHTKANHVAGHSRWAAERHDLPDFLSDPDSLLELLEHQSTNWRGRVLIPSCDRTVTLLAQNREQLSRHYKLAVAPWEITRTVMSKDRTYAIAREVGVETPRDYGPADASTLASNDVDFPVIVKPSISHEFTALFGQKLFVANDGADLKIAIDRLEGTGIDARILDLIPGPDSHFYNYTFFLDGQSDPIAEFGARKLRKSPPRYGVGRVMETADVPQLREPTLELLRRAGWTGVASAEYKLDPRDGRFRLMEVNGRLFLHAGLQRRAGVDYAFLLWATAAGVRLPKVVPNGWKGVWIDLRAEMVYGLCLRSSEGLTWRETFAPYRRPKTFAVWSASDPKPFAKMQLDLARRGTRALFVREDRNDFKRQLQAAIPAH